MRKSYLNGAIAGVVLCFAFCAFVGCDTGSSSSSSTPTTPTEPTTPACKVDFESANIATLSANGFAAEVGDMNATWGDDASMGSATSDMSFSADTSVYASGAASLKVIATVLQNRWSHNVAQWSFKTDLSKAGVSVPIDLTGKTVSIKARVPAAGSLSSVKLVFIDKDGKKSQGKEVAISTKDSWTTVSYTYVDGGSATSDYTVAGFDITKVAEISIVAIKNGAASASDATSETLYIDGLDW